MGAVPLQRDEATPQALAAVRRVAALHVVAGKHFNRGQRAFFFALAYLGWFISAYVFMAATAAVLYVIWRRQFASDAITCPGQCRNRRGRVRETAPRCGR